MSHTCTKNYQEYKGSLVAINMAATNNIKCTVCDRLVAHDEIQHHLSTHVSPRYLYTQ